MSKIYCLFFITVFGNSALLAQEMLSLNKYEIGYCNKSLSSEQVESFRATLQDLENYFIRKGLLADNSGKSYREVYWKIVTDNDLTFEIDTSFVMIDSLESNFNDRICITDIFSTKERMDISMKHIDGFKKLQSEYEGEINPGKVARRIVENLSDSDFELSYFRFSALLTFYNLAQRTGFLGLDTYEDTSIPNSKAVISLVIELNAENELLIAGKKESFSIGEEHIYSFLKKNPEGAIELSSSSSAYYADLTATLDMIHNAYRRLRNESSYEVFHKDYLDLSEEERMEVNKLVRIRVNL